MTFEISTLDDVLKVAGVGTILHEGDAGGSQYWICYSIPTLPGPSTVWIVSHGEMGGPSHHVTSAVIATAPNRVPGCPELPSTMQPVALSNGVKLGDDVSAVLRALGPPQLQRERSISYSYEGKADGEGKCDGGYDQANWLSIESQSRTVQSVHAGQVTSC